MALKRCALPSVVADTDTLLIEAGVGLETVIFSMLLANNSESLATITVKHTDGVNEIFSWKIFKEPLEHPTALDTAIVLEPGDKIYVSCNITTIAVLASGEEK